MEGYLSFEDNESKGSIINLKLPIMPYKQYFETKFKFLQHLKEFKNIHQEKNLKIVALIVEDQ